MGTGGHERRPSSGYFVAILGASQRHATGHSICDFINRAVHIRYLAFRNQCLWRIAHHEQHNWKNVRWL